MCFTLVISSLSIGGLSTLFDAIGEPANSRAVETRGGQPTRTSRIECSCLRYLPLLWPVRQSVVAVAHNDLKLTLGLLSKQHVTHTPISHVSFGAAILTDFWDQLTRPIPTKGAN